jgi:23S rRNA (guanosine2251-2'-O)-methyltransferase
MPMSKIEGRNPVMEALRSGREIDKILIAKGTGGGSLIKILGKAKDKGIPVQYVERQKIDEMSESNAHQGIVAIVAAHRYVHLKTLLKVQKIAAKTHLF